MSDSALGGAARMFRPVSPLPFRLVTRRPTPTRAQLRRKLARPLMFVLRHAECAQAALAGKDPEVALDFLERLIEHAQEAKRRAGQH